MRILVRAPNWVGDLVMATASFADLRRSFPEARIEVLLPPSRAGVLAGAGYLDDIIPDPGRSRGAVFRLAGALRRRGFDLAVIYPNSVRSALAPRLAGIPRRVGFQNLLRDLLLTDVVPDPVSWIPAHWLPRNWHRPRGPRRRPHPMAERYRALVEAVGARPGDGRPILSVTPACEERAAARRREMGIAEGERLIGINPGASFGASKLWPVERFSRAADLLTRRTGRRAIIFVGPGEEAIGRAIGEGMRTRPLSTAGAPLDLELLKPFVRDLDLLLTTDTGPRHYAVAFRVPVVVVMGPTHPGFTALHLEETEVVRRDVPCGPCHLKTCPLDHRCMTLIEPEEVVERAERLLALTR